MGYAKITATHRYDNVIIQDTLHVAVYQPVKVRVYVYLKQFSDAQ